MTQAALAMACGTRERNIIRWENDQHSPRFEHVAAIARATGKDISFFAEEPDGDDDEEAADLPSGRELGDFVQSLIDRAVRRALAEVNA